MNSPAKNCRSAVIPSMRYRDALAAIEWLCQTLGFIKQAVYMNEDGTVAHAQLTFGNGMIMLGSARNGTALEHPSQAGLKQNDEAGEARSVCLIVADADAVYRTAKDSGAKMLMEIQDMDYGGRAFTCSDPEGYFWHVGSYDPWETHS